MVRRRKEKQEAQNAMLISKQRLRLWKGEKLTYADEVDNNLVQDELELVVIGADAVGLYPSMTDVEVAIICYEAVMNSKVKFTNINNRKALQYIAMNLSKEEQRWSPLNRLLPRRTSKGGVRPGVTADPNNEENWRFSTAEPTELEARMIAATVVQIGVLTMFNTHVYSWDGKTFLQKAGGPIGLRSTCAVARIVMSSWDAKWQERITSS